jgi:hypothetical protein
VIYLALIPASLLYVNGVVMDIISSPRRPDYYGQRESTGFLQDENGGLDVGKKIIVSVIVGAGLLGGAYFEPLVGIIGLSGLGLVSVWQYFQNRSKQKQARERQTRFLTTSAQYTPDQAEDLFHQMHFNNIGALKTSKAGMWFYTDFRWIQGPSPEIVRRKLMELALKPSRDWFPK